MNSTFAIDLEKIWHTLLANFGFKAQIRYVVENIGPESGTTTMSPCLLWVDR